MNYASSTGVVVLIQDDLLTVSHVGDSKACVGKHRRCSYRDNNGMVTIQLRLYTCL